jgi:hypothetical protein
MAEWTEVCLQFVLLKPLARGERKEKRKKGGVKKSSLNGGGGGAFLIIPSYVAG